MHYGVKNMKWGVRKQRSIIGSSYKVNAAVANKKASIAQKLGMKSVAKRQRANADYYKKEAKDLTSGKVGKPKTTYQKAMRWLGKTNYATHAIIRSKDLNPQQKAAALKEQHLMRKADGWYQRRAATFAAVKAADIAMSVYKKR